MRVREIAALEMGMSKTHGLNSDRALGAVRTVPLALSGAIVGAAVSGVLFPASGISVDAVGARAGYATDHLVIANHLI